MSKSLITAATLLLLSTASFAGQANQGPLGEGADVDARCVFDHSRVCDKSAKKRSFDKRYITNDALKIESGDRMEVLPNYINRSQLR